MNESFQVNIQEIIPLVEKKPVLWDRRLEFFKHKSRTLAAWDEICMSYNKEYADMSASAKSNYRSIVIRKWRNVKDSYRKYVLKTKRGETGHKKYIYDKELLFLSQIIRTKTKKTTPSTPTLSSDEMSSSLECAVKSESFNIEFIKDNWNQDETNTKFSACDKFQYQNESESEIFHNKIEFSDTSKSILPDKSHQASVVHEAPSFSNSQTKTITNDPISQSLNCKEEEDRHVSFLKGVLPSIKNFNEEQVLKFQMGVIQLIQSIRENK